MVQVGETVLDLARTHAREADVGNAEFLAEDGLTPAERVERGGEDGGIAGAPSFAEYWAGLAAAGLCGITITVTHHVAEGVHPAIIRAARP